MMENSLNILTAFDGLDLLLFLIGTAVKATFLIGFAALLCRSFRRFSAATRHLIWASVLIASLVLPFLSLVKGWEISVLPNQLTALETRSPAQISPGQQTSENLPTTVTNPRDSADFLETKFERKDYQKDPRFFGGPSLIPNISELPGELAPQRTASFLTQLINLILVIWLIGVCLFLGRLINGIISTNRLAQQTNEFENPALNELFSTLLTELKLKGQIRLLRSERTTMPIVCGIRYPVVILPDLAETWTDERCRVVLLHELAHIARRDCLTQLLAQAACVFYWFNPVVWLAARRQRVEREQACDAFVLNIGTRPSDYARHLLEIARSMRQKTSAFEWSPIAMAHHSQLEERVLAILNPKNQQTSHPVSIIILFLIGILFLSLAFIRPTTANGADPAAAQINTESPSENLSKNQSSDSSLSNPGFEEKETAEKVKTELNLDETIEKQTKNEIQSETSGQENESSGFEPTTEHKQAANEKISDVLVENDSNLFIKAEYKQELQTQPQSDDFIDEMASVGFKNLSINELIQLKSVGVTAEYIKTLRSLGFDNMTIREIANLRAVGVTSKYIEEIRKAGYKDVTVRELSSLRALGVTAGFITNFREAGFENLSVRDLTNLKASHITLDFINTMNSLGFGKLTLKELTNLKFTGVTPEFVRLARSRLGNELTLKQIIGLKNTGILKEKEKQ